MSNSGNASVSGPPPSQQPKILLAKPGLLTPVSVARREDDTALSRRSRPPIASLNLLSDSWDFHIDRFLPFLTENTDFMVVGVIGAQGIGKSTIMDELYGFDGSSPGMLPPFTVQSEENRAMARHCTSGIEPRVSAERLILLDTQPIFSPSILSDITKPDGSSTISVLSGESVSAELAHELMGIQLGVLLASICHVLLVISEGIHKDSMHRLMSTVDLLKHGIPDPSLLSHSQSSTLGPEKENNKVDDGGEYMATLVFVRTKVSDQDFTPRNIFRLQKALAKHLSSSSLLKENCEITGQLSSPAAACTEYSSGNSTLPTIHLIPFKSKDDLPRVHYESYITSIRKLRDQVLSMNSPSFTKPISEREWLKNSAKIWDLVKNSPIIAEYARTLQSSGLYRR